MWVLVCLAVERPQLVLVGSLVRSLDPCTAFHHMQYKSAVDDHHKISVKISRGYILIGDNAITVIENWLDK